MTREEAVKYLKSFKLCTPYTMDAQGVYYRAVEVAIKALEQEPTTKNDLGVDLISRTDALRVAKNEYLRGWHNALCKALSEKYSIHCEEGNFSVIQEETITGLGLSMNCALGKDVENYMSTMPTVTPQESKIVPIAEFKFDKDKLKELVDEAVLTTIMPQELLKPCISSRVCEHDRNEVIDKIRDEINKIYEREGNSFDCLNALDELKEFINKYKIKRK